jgi:hypothetical protein
MTCLKWLRLLNVPLKESCVVFIIWEHIIVVSSFDALYLGWLGACLHHVWLQTSCSSLYDHLVFDLWYHFMLCLIIFCCYAWLWPLLVSLLVAPSLLLAFTCTEREYFSCIQLPKMKLFQCVHYIYLLAFCYSKYIHHAFIYLPN